MVASVLDREQSHIQEELVEEIQRKISYSTNPIRSTSSQNYVKRNSLQWSSKLYKEISKSVSMYYNSHKYEMDQYKVELDDLTQKVAFTLYRWQNFDPEAYGKKLYQYIIPIITQKLSKEKKYHFKTRQNISISLDDEFSNNSSKDSNETCIKDTVADTSYRFLEFVEECLQRIPEDHKFYVEDIAFNTREVFRLMFNNYSGEEIAASVGVDGKKFRKMKRILTKQFYAADMKDLWNSLPSNVEFRPDYFLAYSKEESLANEQRELEYRASLSGEVKTTSIDSIY